LSFLERRRLRRRGIHQPLKAYVKLPRLRGRRVAVSCEIGSLNARVLVLRQ
jgi:esterase/lipase superfamily enzyme